MNKHLCFWLTIVVGISSVCVADAQYYPRRNPWGYNPYRAYNYSQGAALSGAADLVNAQGTYQNQQQQARITAEQAKQMQLQTQKKAFDLKKYEKENTPSYTENQEKIEQERIRAALGNPPVSEITSGRAMNILLPYLRNLSIAGTQGTPVPLNDNILQQINVTAGGNTGSPGILKAGKKQSWPIALRGPVQKRLDENVSKAIDKVRSDTLTVADITKINKDVDRLEKSLSDNIRSGAIDTTMWLNGRRYLEDYKVGLRTLQSPNAVELLGGGFRAEGRDVQELVSNMTKNGLEFAPASPGGTSAYVSLHNSMVTYAMMSHNNSGFRVNLVPTGFQK